MRAADLKKLISRETQKKIFIQELLEKGITEKNGTKIDDLDYYSIRQEVVLSRYREKDVENPNNQWF